MEEMMLAVNAATTPAVQMWMNWMLVIFAISLIFVWKHVGARFALAAFIASSVLGYFIFSFTNQPHLMGIAHLIFWLPLAIYLYQTVLRSDAIKVISPYGIWVALLLLTIVISLVFDVKDVIQVLTGAR
jgi:hypothetical protein